MDVLVLVVLLVAWPGFGLGLEVVSSFGEFDGLSALVGKAGMVVAGDIVTSNKRDYPGGVRVFVEEQEVDVLVPDAEDDQSFGTDIALEMPYLVVGAPKREGTVYVFKFDAQEREWNLEKKLVGPVAGAACGTAVDIKVSGDGLVDVAFGCPGTSTFFHVQKKNGVWDANGLEGGFQNGECGTSIVAMKNGLISGCPVKANKAGMVTVCRRESNLVMDCEEKIRPDGLVGYGLMGKSLLLDHETGELFISDMKQLLRYDLGTKVLSASFYGPNNDVTDFGVSLAKYKDFFLIGNRGTSILWDRTNGDSTSLPSAGGVGNFVYPKDENAPPKLVLANGNTAEVYDPFATSSPTAAPTLSPTTSVPTLSPVPTPEPTNSPTLSPIPTAEPTIAPSMSPTLPVPTSSPTEFDDSKDGASPNDDAAEKQQDMILYGSIGAGALLFALASLIAVGVMKRRKRNPTYQNESSELDMHRGSHHPYDDEDGDDEFGSSSFERKETAERPQRKVSEVAMKFFQPDIDDIV